ncbi:hypothetical protein D4764_04G0002690, partial [Takifugu flavidus]
MQQKMGRCLQVAGEPQLLNNSEVLIYREHQNKKSPVEKLMGKLDEKEKIMKNCQEQLLQQQEEREFLRGQMELLQQQKDTHLQSFRNRKKRSIWEDVLELEKLKQLRLTPVSEVNEDDEEDKGEEENIGERLEDKMKDKAQEFCQNSVSLQSTSSEGSSSSTEMNTSDSDSSVSPTTAKPGDRGRDQDSHVLRRKAKKEEGKKEEELEELDASNGYRHQYNLRNQRFSEKIPECTAELQSHQASTSQRSVSSRDSNSSPKISHSDSSASTTTDESWDRSQVQDDNLCWIQGKNGKFSNSIVHIRIPAREKDCDDRNKDPNDQPDPSSTPGEGRQTFGNHGTRVGFTSVPQFGATRHVTIRHHHGDDRSFRKQLIKPAQTAAVS